jgi:pimeloyl-ACP methyl ester carboxylesterase
MADVISNGARFNLVRLGPPSDAPRPHPPVVFLHGLIMDNLSSFYYTLAPTVARTHDVLCYDLRGHGRSERPPTGYGLPDAVDDLCGLLDAAGITEPVQLVGNSYGGTIAIAAALWAPERVEAVALLEAHPAFDGWAAGMVADLEDVVAGFDDPDISEYFRSGAPRGLRRMISCCEELVTKTSMPADFLASPLTTPERLSEVTCPSLLIYGDASDILDHAFTLHAALPGADLRILEGCSHHLLMEASDRVVGHLVPWLAGDHRVPSVAGKVGA